MWKFIEIFFSLTNLIFLTAILGWLFLFKKRSQRAGRILIFLSLISFYFFSITPISDVAIKPLENGYGYCPLSSPKLGLFKNIVVLSGGFRNSNFGPGSLPEESTLSRVIEALRINHRYPQDRIIISGNCQSISEAKSFLVSLGLPAKNIIIDDKSHSTYQNARYVKTFLKETPFILVTSAFHMPRAMFIFKRLGMNPYPCPTDFRQEDSYSCLDFLPRSKNLKKSNLAFHEYVGMLFYRLYAR